MSAPRRRGDRTPAEALEFLTREAREETETPRVPPVDWSHVEARLFERVKAEMAAERQAERTSRSRRLWIPVAVGLAAAAAAALFVGRASDVAPLEAPAVAKVDRTAGSLVSVDGAGAAIVAGRAEAPGSVIALGDVLEAHGARATFLRPAANGRPEVTFALEDDARATVTHVDGALILALERGAIEAQVAHVDSGEAFAVDVGATRVAVHGTHLRVARQSDFAIVDLSEGVVSIGAPPRSGSTYGALVTAPAHVEFVPGDAAATIRVDHAPSSVRPPLTLGRPPVVAAAPAPPQPETAVAAAPARPAAPRPLALSAPKQDAPASASPAPAAALADPNAESTIAQAVRACLAARPASPDVVLVTVATTLDLHVGDDGVVQFARFNPPIAPEAQSCATATIYRTRFAHGGAIAIPIDYQR